MSIRSKPPALHDQPSLTFSRISDEWAEEKAEKSRALLDDKVFQKLADNVLHDLLSAFWRGEFEIGGAGPTIRIGASAEHAATRQMVRAMLLSAKARPPSVMNDDKEHTSDDVYRVLTEYTPGADGAKGR